MKYLIMFSLLFSTSVGAEKLLTKNYEIEITRHCDEGYVTCDNVSYVGINKKTGDAITLKGKTNHSVCADGVTPCKFQGYTFTNGNVEYKIYSRGILEVIRNGSEILLSEEGEWEY